MFRTNSLDQVLKTGVIEIDAGEGVSFRASATSTTDLEHPEDLGTRHLDDIKEPGFYTQIFASRATKAKGYPHEGIAGVLEVKVWNEKSGYFISTFTPWTAEPAMKRAFYGSTWRDWTELSKFTSQIDIPLMGEWDPNVDSSVTGYRSGDTVTISAWRLSLEAEVTGDVKAYDIPYGYRPPPLYSASILDSRGARAYVSVDNEVFVVNPSTPVSHHAFTFVTLDDPTP